MIVWKYWETVTEEEGEIVERDQGILSPSEGYVSFANVWGDKAINLHYKYAETWDIGWVEDPEEGTGYDDKARQDDLESLARYIVEAIDGVDFIDNRGDGKMIVYGCAQPSANDDPYVRSVAIEGISFDVDRLVKILEDQR